MKSRAVQFLSLLMILAFAACHHNPVSSDSTPVLVDYFPLKVGNQWAYSLSMYSDEAGELYTWVNGTDIWRVLSATSSDQGAVYTFQETVNITFIRRNLSNGVPSMDTIVYSDVTYPFTVADPSNHVLAFTFLPTSAGAISPSSWITRVVQNLGTKRYYLTPDSVLAFRFYEDPYKIITDSARVAASLGFTYIYQKSVGGGNNRWSYSDSLVSYQLK